ncbi:unnamed protein product [Lactuca virosa]|uniref:Uncharacterized protein n=1 Tax=Lactuca virosa TaxID=75947 RepID=A0AAU9NGY2_9ASTR|nr:unnamed protein product [Lactuca virosa]
MFICFLSMYRRLHNSFFHNSTPPSFIVHLVPLSRCRRRPGGRSQPSSSSRSRSLFRHHPLPATFFRRCQSSHLHKFEWVKDVFDDAA